MLPLVLRLSLQSLSVTSFTSIPILTRKYIISDYNIPCIPTSRFATTTTQYDCANNAPPRTFHLKATTDESEKANENDNENKNEIDSSIPTIIPFHQEVINFFLDHNITWQETNVHETNILAFERIESDNDDDDDDNKKRYKLGLHIIPAPNSHEECLNPKLCKHLTDNIHQSPFQNIIHLHEDVWQNKKDIVKARILAKLSRLRNRWYARKTIVQRIPKQRAMDFLLEHHLWGCTRAKFNYGLFLKTNEKEGEGEGDLLAVATFSPRRHVSRHGSNRMYRSHELIRYCAKKDEVVLGGITKLLAGFCRDLAPDDLVTCIDRDFGDGEGWSKIGFERVQGMPPLVMAVGESERSDETGLIRKYLVGAGVGISDEKTQSRQERPVIDSVTYSDLEHAEDNLDATAILARHKLFPVFDTGVERRMLIVQRSKLQNQGNSKKEELGLEDIAIPDDISVMDIWNDSSPSFPNRYYSSNRGIELLLEAAEL